MARSVLLAAEVLDGEAALRLGLVARLGDLDAALAWADEIAALAPLTVAGHKLALERLTPRRPTDPDVTAAFAAGVGQRRPGRGAGRLRRAPAAPVPGRVERSRPVRRPGWPAPGAPPPAGGDETDRRRW